MYYLTSRENLDLFVSNHSLCTAYAQWSTTTAEKQTCFRLMNMTRNKRSRQKHAYESSTFLSLHILLLLSFSFLKCQSQPTRTIAYNIKKYLFHTANDDKNIYTEIGQPNHCEKQIFFCFQIEEGTHFPATYGNPFG